MFLQILALVFAPIYSLFEFVKKPTDTNVQIAGLAYMTIYSIFNILINLARMFTFNIDRFNLINLLLHAMIPAYYYYNFMVEKNVSSKYQSAFLALVWLYCYVGNTLMQTIVFSGHNFISVAFRMASEILIFFSVKDIVFDNYISAAVQNSKKKY